MPRRLVAITVCLALALCSASARAETDAQRRALELFDQSEAAYQRGQFDEAARLLREAYAMQKEPVLLYNLARAYEGLGDQASAAKAYEDFLTAQPDAKDKGAIQQRITTLRRQIAEREAEKRRAAQKPPTEKRPSAAPWIVAGFGVAGLGTGVAFTLLSNAKHDQGVKEPVQTIAARDQDSAKTEATVATVAYVGGGALMAVGIVWGVLDVHAAGSVAHVEVTPTLGGLRLNGTF